MGLLPTVVRTSRVPAATLNDGAEAFAETEPLALAARENLEAGMNLCAV